MSYNITVRMRCGGEWEFFNQSKIPDLAGPIVLANEGEEVIMFATAHVICVSYREEDPVPECPAACGCSGCSEGNCCEHGVYAPKSLSSRRSPWGWPW